MSPKRAYANKKTDSVFMTPRPAVGGRKTTPLLYFLRKVIYG